MVPQIKVINLGKIPSLNTQTVYHAAALERSTGKESMDMIIICWPDSPVVCCGYNQILETDVDLDYCKKAHIPVIRRSCGGGQVLLDGNQIFYQVIVHLKNNYLSPNIAEFFRQLLAPVVKTYQDLGVDCVYKPINDIITKTSSPRKLSGNGAALYEQALFLVGNFILSFPRAEMAKTLRVPDEKFRDKVIKSLEAGISSFYDELGHIPPTNEIIERYLSNFAEILGVELVPGELSDATIQRMNELNLEYQTDEWLHEVEKRSKTDLVRSIKIREGHEVVQRANKTPGGLIRVLCEIQDNKIKDILISGDFWVIPFNTLNIIEERLRGKTLSKETLLPIVKRIYQEKKVQTPGTTAEDIIKTILGEK